MATKWFSDRKETRHANKCQGCKDGYHIGSPHGCKCSERACDCWCRTESVPAARYRPPVWRLPPEMRSVFATLRTHGVECRAMRTHLVWKPRPSELPDDVRVLLREYLLPLTSLLFLADWPKVESRPFWRAAGIGYCDGCGMPSALVDPLGTRRHTWCGWVGRPPGEHA